MKDLSDASFFGLRDRVAVITGGCGLLGMQHATALAEYGAIPVLLDVQVDSPHLSEITRAERLHPRSIALACDITDDSAVSAAARRVVKTYGRVDILINNAANNPKMESGGSTEFSRLENFPLHQWTADIAVGLTGAFLCSRHFGSVMAAAGRGVILNIASDLAVIGPDQRLYRQDELPEDRQPVKPVTYSVVKSGIVGLTRYLATYWADRNVRCNSICPGGVFAGQSAEFVRRLSERVPLGRMAQVDEYQGAVVFLCSDASSYMTGENVVVDGGRSCW